MVQAIPMVAVVMTKLKVRLFPHSGNTDCSGNGGNVGISGSCYIGKIGGSGNTACGGNW